MKKQLVFSAIFSASLLFLGSTAYAGCYEETTILSQSVGVTPAQDCLKFHVTGSGCVWGVSLYVKNTCEESVFLKQIAPHCESDREYTYYLCDDELEVPSAPGDLEYLSEYPVSSEGEIRLEGSRADEVFEVLINYEARAEPSTEGCGCASTLDTPLTPAAPLLFLCLSTVVIGLRRRGKV